MVEPDAQESGRRFALLYRLSQTFNSSLDLNEVLDRVMDEVIKAINAERGFIALRNQHGDLEFRSARGLDQTTIDHPEFEISRGVVEKVARSGEGVRVSNAQEDDRFRSRKSVLDLKLRSILCVPLKLKDKLIGVIYIENRVQAGIFSDRQLELLIAIASSAATAIDNARLYQVAVEKGRMERELQMAYQVQSSLIPYEIPQAHGWEFTACWRPAREVSGDFYDFIQNQDGQMNFVIADVTDKGMPAALFMAMTRSLVRSSIDQAPSLAKGITNANRHICLDSSLSMPVTLFACKLDLDTGHLVYVNAGHNPPMYFNADKKEFSLLTRTGIFMGFDEKASYEQKSFILNPGDFVLCYTDGVLDALNSEGEAFEMARFKNLVDQHLQSPACDLLDAIIVSHTNFTGETLPYDDLTILIIKRSAARDGS